MGIPLGHFAFNNVDTGLERMSTSAHYMMHQSIGDGRYFSVYMRRGSTAGSSTIDYIYGLQYRRLVRRYSESNTTYVAYTGTWVARASSTDAYGGTYRYSTVEDSLVRFTTPVTCSVVGAYFLATSNAGLCAVTIDGSN